MVRRLEVWCFARLAGALVDDPPAALAFSYDAAWLAAGLPPLSQSLPLDGTFSGEAVSAYFGGLLPEGNPRRSLARQLGVAEGNVFGMLDALGGDTAGAISVFRPGAPQASAADADAVQWLDDAGVAALVDELPVRPMHADDEGEWRLSLAGAQDKLPVVVDASGRIGLTRGRTPSNAILKTPIEHLHGTVVNEAFCLALARDLGVPAAVATPRRVADREFLLVQRFDRAERPGGGVVRLHQEDLCQALGVPSERKYESDGGPGLTDCFGLVRRASQRPAPDLLACLDLVAVNFVVGNHDSHGKNLSLLYAPDGTTARLAPAYDVLSTIVYQRVRAMSRKMAMRIGGEYRPDWVRPRHIERMLREAGLAVPGGKRRLRAVAEAAPGAAAALRAQFAADGWDHEIFDEMLPLIAQRAELLVAAAA